MPAKAIETLAAALDEDSTAILVELAKRQTSPKGALYTSLGLTRHRGDKAMIRLESLGFVFWAENGTAKSYRLTMVGAHAFKHLRPNADIERREEI